MACVETMAPVDVDSEREEGEIVDELDELSDISSEEEYLLRQRLQVLETYNNVLERKEAKRASSIGPGMSFDLVYTLLGKRSCSKLAFRMHIMIKLRIINFWNACINITLCQQYAS